jgi:hypothetical protein
LATNFSRRPASPPSVPTSFSSTRARALSRGLDFIFSKESEGRCLNHKNKAFKLEVDDTEKKSQLVEEVTVGSVTIPIFYSPNRIKIPGEAPVVGADGAETPVDEFKIYDSYILVFYEGSLRNPVFLPVSPNSLCEVKTIKIFMMICAGMFYSIKAG